MKLNQDCVRDLMLTIENDVPLNETVSLLKLRKLPNLQKYDEDETIYVAVKLEEAQLINATPIRGDNMILEVMISELTYEGHQFLDNIRDPKVWKTVKEKSSILKGVSISILSDMGSKVAKNFLGLE